MYDTSSVFGLYEMKNYFDAQVILSVLWRTWLFVLTSWGPNHDILRLVVTLIARSIPVVSMAVIGRLMHCQMICRHGDC